MGAPAPPPPPSTEASAVLGGVGLGLTGVGTVVSIVSQIRAGSANAQIARNNARILRDRRAGILQQGSQAESEVRARGAEVTAAAVTASGANAISTTTGSVSNILKSTAASTAVAAATIRSNAARAAHGIEPPPTSARGALVLGL